MTVERHLQAMIAKIEELFWLKAHHYFPWDLPDNLSPAQ